MQANMGMAGEFRVVVKRADGSTKIDTGYQKNLILNQGLDFFGGNNGSYMMAYCVIGSGNSQPVYTQNKLDTAITGVSGATFSTKYDYDASRDGNLYKTNKVCKYSFTGLNNVNISEVGLASTYSNTTTYFLCTRALIKDVNGKPTTITVLSGEILEVYYKLWAVFDTSDKNGQINLLDGVGGSVALNYKTRIADAGLQASYVPYNLNLFANKFGVFAGYGQPVYSSTSDLATISSKPNNNATLNGFSVGTYVANSYKNTLTINADINTSNITNRSIYMLTTLGAWQIRFGSVADDSPITKTNTQTLSIPIEFSWSRYEGAL